MASIDFMKAAVESGYVKEKYSSIDYQSLENALNEICEEFLDDVFGEK